ncbi:MAG: glycosyltransferase, partial [Cytophagaceae bacterium]
MQEFPSVSVVIPSWNQGRFIDRTLLSILKQDYPGSIEIIVSDGGSTDETVEVLKKYGNRLIWWSARDKGFVDAVTKGVACATGEILAVQSSDDYYLPGAFRAMAAAFQQYPEASFISGGEYAIDLEGVVLNSSNPAGEITPHTILFQTIPPQHATFVKRRFFEETGGMRVEVDMCADIDQWYRVAHLAPGHYIPNMLAVYQLHPDQRTVTSDKWFPNLVKMVEL